jgi:hypothetical protein
MRRRRGQISVLTEPMKCAFLIALLFVLTTLNLSCSHKRPSPKPTSLSLPTNCLMGFVADKSRCRAVSMDQAICDGVVVKFACLKAQQ